MRLTIEQRIRALERNTVVLHDTTKMLHRMLKEQGQLISDYITRTVASGGINDVRKPGHSRAEDVLYTFFCRRRFERLDKDIEKIRRSVDSIRFGLKAG